MISHLLLLASLTSLANLSLSAQEIDLVQLGQETFQAVGCAECHAIEHDDASAKTGPTLFGRFQKEPQPHLVQSGDAQQQVTADLKYLTSSLRTPAADLAMQAEDLPYPPVMPPYDEKILSVQKVEALHHYLQTLNEVAKQGPSKVMAPLAKEEAHASAATDPSEILVTDRTRIYRGRLPKTSARAVHVGTSNGLNYSFDPRTLSIERVWWGGFLNLKEEMSGRGGNLSRIGEQAKELKINGSLLAPLDPATGEPVDLSFKSPTGNEQEKIIASMSDSVDFLDQLAATDADFLGYNHATIPTFRYRIGENEINLQFDVSSDGLATLVLTGTLRSPQTFRLSPLIHGEEEDLTIKEFPAAFTFRLPVESTWRPWQASNFDAPQQVAISIPNKLQLPRGYSAKTITPPLDRHGRPQLFEPMGMAQATDGAIIVSTRTAGLWKLQGGTWTQIAEGLLDALGVIIEDDGSLIVGQKPELTRLRDTDGDGWMDRYETLCDDFLFTHNYHEYLHGPAKGADGNYYIQLNLGHIGKPELNYMAGGRFMGTQGGLRGWALQVTPEGVMTPFASGLRSPAGLATGPDGALYYTENQGEFVGTSKLFRLERDKFYGNPCGLIDLPGMTPESPEIAWDTVKGSKEKALALMPHSRIANAPGSPAWAPSESEFGPFGGHMFVGDQTLSQVFRILPKADHEAALIPFTKGLSSGAMRLLFAQDHSLYIGQTGRGWRAQGGEEDGLVRIFRNEEAAESQLLDITREDRTFTLHFSQKLSKAPANESVKVTTWDYLDSPAYGSPENNQASLTVTSLALAKDELSLRVTVENLPATEDNSVYHIELTDLPEVAELTRDAYYSISRK